MRKYPYYPAWDGKHVQPIITKCVELCGKRWGTKNLGDYVVRPVRNPLANGALSTHATGFSVDLKYKDEAQARIIWDFFVNNSAALGVAEVHWYTHGKYGAGYRCSRGEGKAGVKIFTADDNAGKGGAWLHLELCEQDPTAFEATFRALKPTNAG